MSHQKSLFANVSLEDYGLVDAVEVESTFSIEGAEAQLTQLVSGLETSFVVYGHASLMAAAMESTSAEVSAQTQEVMEVNEVAMSAVLDTLQVSVEADDEKEGEKEPGMLRKAWEKIKAFFRAIGEWFKKQWGKITGLFKAGVAKLRKKSKLMKAKDKAVEVVKEKQEAVAALIQSVTDGDAFDAAMAAGGKIKDAATDTKTKLTKVASLVKGKLADSKVASAVLDGIADAVEAVNGMGETLKDKTDAVVKGFKGEEAPNQAEYDLGKKAMKAVSTGKNVAVGVGQKILNLGFGLFGKGDDA